jgi:hypothetical protein
MWFTEDPWPPLMILALLAIVFGIAWNATHRGLYLFITAGLIALGGLVFIVEELIETKSEQVEARVYALANAVVDGDPAKVISFISPEAKGLREEIGSGMEEVDVDEGLRITDVEVTMDDSATQAKTHFRANGMGTLRKTFSHAFTTRWNVTWKKEGETWRIVQIEQLELYKDEVINEWKGL